MFLNPFDEPRAKITRVRRHIAELVGEQERYVHCGGFERFLERRESDGWIVQKLRAAYPPPGEAATITADILGGLRSSLDLAVTAAARIDGATNLKNTYFHFADTEKNWKDTKKGRTRAAPQIIVDAMYDLKPWKDGTPLLYALSKLAVLDKHQILVPVALAPDRYELGGFTAMGGVDFSVMGWDFTRHEGSLFAVPPEPFAELKNLALNAFFAFGNVDVVAHQPVIPITRKLADVCSQIIDTFERVMRSNLKG